jgi:ferrous iron transport protein B
MEKELISHKKIILVGNPNVGKSLMFNKLTNQYAIVSNYSGTTVDITKGILNINKKSFTVMDTPGTNSLFPLSEDEKITREVIIKENPDLIINVCDMKNIERSLEILLELSYFKKPLIMVLNMADEAIEHGIKIDTKKLSDILGIPVIATNALGNEGIDLLKDLIYNEKATIPSLKISYSTEINNLLNNINSTLENSKSFKNINEILKNIIPFFITYGDENILKYLDSEKNSEIISDIKKIIFDSKKTRLEIFETHSTLIKKITDNCKQKIEKVSKKISKILAKFNSLSIKPFSGTIILLLIIFLMYEFVGVFAAGTLVNFFENTIFQGLIIPALTKIFTFINIPILQEFFVGKYGIFSVAIPYAVAIIFPIVSAFFLFFGLLEDSGYLPRLSILLDKIFHAFGLNGKAILPMILGLGCGTMAVISTRILETKKERLLIVILLSLAIPCSAQLGVILGLLSGISLKASLVWAISLIFSIILVGKLMTILLKGEISDFIMEIPPIRVPSFKNIFSKIKMRLFWYMKEVLPLFIIATVILFFLDKFKILEIIRNLCSPIVVKVLELPAEVTDTFIMGFLRRDYGVVGLYDMAKNGLLSEAQIITGTIVITLMIPCLAQFLIIIKEYGYKKSIFIFSGVIAYAIAFGFLIKNIVKMLGF